MAPRSTPDANRADGFVATRSATRAATRQEAREPKFGVNPKRSFIHFARRVQNSLECTSGAKQLGVVISGRFRSAFLVFFVIFRRFESVLQVMGYIELDQD